MRVVALGGSSFVAGFRLAGAAGYVVSTPREAFQKIRELQQQPDIGLIIVSEDLSREFRGELNEIRAKKPIPLIYELPPPSAQARRIDYRAILREVLGV
ncbi:V-type ATP synthase subunit F [archaeon HR01]|nr:V-type ATP synthase subunit F [archaeon HR01]